MVRTLSCVGVPVGPWDGSYIKLCGRARGPMGMVRTLSCVGVPVGPWGWFIH